MMKMEAGIKPWFDWVLENISQGAVIGVDETQMTAGDFSSKKTMFEKKEIKLVECGCNLVDEVWGEAKPSMPMEKVWHLEDKYTG